MYTIILPAYVFENNLLNFILLMGNGSRKKEVSIDFREVTYYVPSAITVMLSKIHQWRREGKSVGIINYSFCKAFQYLQRINFFKHCSMELGENFFRHDPTGRFVPIKVIDYNTGELATEVATCIAPELAESFEPDESGFFDCIEYSVSELGNNVIQHSKRSVAFVSAQYSETKDLVRLAIVDDGIGIKESFQQNECPFDISEMSDLDVLKKALEPEVSSKIHSYAWGESVNAGVGLTLLCELARKLGGDFVLVSGNAYFSLSQEVLFLEDARFQGTLCAFVFKRNNIQNFGEILYQAKKDVGLIKDINPFKRLFM